MVTVTSLPPNRPFGYSCDHHIGSPPSSFENPWPSFSSANSGLLNIFQARFGRNRPAFIPLPDRSELVAVEKPTWGAGAHGFKTTWIGHASFLLETTPQSPATRGVRILCDPVFSERTSPVSFIGPKRYTPTPCALSELPDVDLVIISHSHYDHCDRNTLTPLYQRHRSNIHFIAGLNNAAWFPSIGIPATQVTELDWWDGVSVTVPEVGTVRLTCTPSQHFSSRTPFDRNQTLWCSYMIEEAPSDSGLDTDDKATSKFKKVFFSGDTGYRSIPGSEHDPTLPSPTLDLSTIPHCTAFEEIGKKFSPIDLSLLPIGLCSPRVFSSPVHANPLDSIDIHRDLLSKRSIGMHWGTVRGGLSQEYEDVRDPPRWWREEAEKAGLKWRLPTTAGTVGGDVDGNSSPDPEWEIGLMSVGETIVLE